MAYYLKKTKQKNRTYLAIDESFYSRERRETVHKCFKSLGSVEAWKEKGMEDPISYFQQEVDRLNSERAGERAAAEMHRISDKSPVLHLGYFPLKAILEKLQIKKYIGYFNLANDFSYDLYELLSSLIYAGAVSSFSREETFYDALSCLYGRTGYSREELFDGLSFLGNEYQKIIEIFTVRAKKHFDFDVSITCFDLLDFCFLKELEDGFLLEGEEEERRTDIKLGLLLDRNLIPIDMKIYTGSEAENLNCTDAAENIKAQNGITGRTVHAASLDFDLKQNMSDSKMHGTYRDLKSIEELFKAMKDEVSSRPDFLRSENVIKGHFLICYLVIFLERLFLLRVADNKYSSEEILDFIKNFRVVKVGSGYLNLALNGDFISFLKEKTALPLTDYFLSESRIKSVLRYKI